MSDDPLRLDEADADLAAGRARPASEVFAALSTPDIAAALERVREHERFMWSPPETATTEQKRASAKQFDDALATIKAHIAEQDRRIAQLEGQYRRLGGNP